MNILKNYKNQLYQQQQKLKKLWEKTKDKEFINKKAF
jgi:hypothetical protein